jgi:hypothetical protein
VSLVSSSSQSQRTEKTSSKSVETASLTELLLLIVPLPQLPLPVALMKSCVRCYPRAGGIWASAVGGNILSGSRRKSDVLKALLDNPLCASVASLTMG